jgi:hypothetical protein
MDMLMWQSALLQQLDQSGPHAHLAAEFIRAHEVKVGFRKASRAVGAFWYIDGNIYLNTAHYSIASPVTNPRLLCLVVHETLHLKQGIPTALSIYGELEAWQVDFRLYDQLTGISPTGVLAQLLALPLSLDRVILLEARALMQAFGGKGYRADLLPLYPWSKEIVWWFTRKSPA